MRVGLFCDWAGRCAGCRLIERDYADQLDWKRGSFLAMWRRRGLPIGDSAGLTIESLGEGGLRDRGDMTLHEEGGRTVLGLWDRDKTEILDLARCPQMSPALAAWFSEFRERIPPIQFGNIRLRVSPDGTRGVWLDFPNKTITALLDDGAWLTELAQRAIVELGQRRRRLQFSGSTPVLAETVLFPWFETYLGAEERGQALYCAIGGFTQPGFRANRALVARVRALVLAAGIGDWLELGAGVGNFTLPLAAMGCRVTAADMDPLAGEGLRRAAKEAGLATNIELERVNIHHASDRLRALAKNRLGILADPPRSGLGRFVDLLAQTPRGDRPRFIVYVSCHAQSMIDDIAGLYPLGYRLSDIAGLDQFPQSEHCEWLGLLRQS